MITYILAALLAVGPTPADRLAEYITGINPDAAPYARPLARAILAEAKRHKLDPAYLAAIAHTESHFRLTAKGRWFESGVWQIWPWAPYLKDSWERLRVTKPGLRGFPNVSWGKLPRKVKIKVSMDPARSTFLAAHLLAHIRRSCRRPNSARCYARYNRPSAPRAGYIRAIRFRARRIRKTLAKNN